MKRIQRLITAALAVLLTAFTLVQTAAAADLAALTTEGTYESNTTSLRQIGYRLLVPQNYDKSRSYNLLVYFHDSEGTGSDSAKTVAHSDKTKLLELLCDSPAYADVFVLIPQCPAEESWVRKNTTDGKYFFSADGQTPAQEIFMDLLEQDILKKYNIDGEHICLLGVGEGGTMVFDLLARYPSRFMAGISVGGTADSTKGAAYAAQNLRVFYAENDTDSARFVSMAALRTAFENSDTASITALPGKQEQLFAQAFADDSLLQWALSLAAPQEVTGEVPESISEATQAANSQALQSDEAEKTAAKQTSESDEAPQTFFERYHISQRALVLVLLGAALIVGTILLLVGYAQTKPR